MKKLVVVIFVLSIMFFIQTQAQWQPDVRLTNDPASSNTSYNNAWCVASSGNNVHVVWYDNRDGNWEIYYKRSTDGGSNWGADTRLTNNTANSWFPSIAVSGSVIHVVWHDDRYGDWEIYYKRSTDGGANWGADVRLTNAILYSLYSSVAVSGSVVHVVWEDYRNNNYEIYYKRSEDGGSGWGADTRLTNNTNESVYPSVAVSGSVVHVVWYDLRDGNYEIYYKRSTDGGSNWGDDTRLTNNSGISYSPSVAVIGSDVHVVWFDFRDGNYEIYYKRSTDGGSNWGADTRLTNYTAESYPPSIAISGSFVHVVWWDYRDGNPEIYYKRSTDGGVSWGADILLSDYPDWSYSPSISVSGSVIHVVWRDDRDGNNEIYYKRNPTGHSVLKSVLNSIYRPNDGKTQTALITLSDSLCIGQIDSVWWFVNNVLVSNQHSFTYPYKQGTTFVKIKIKNDSINLYDSATTTITRCAWKKYTSGQILAGLSLISDSIFYGISTGDAVYRLDINGNTVYTLSATSVLSSSSISYDSCVFFASGYDLLGFSRTGIALWPSIPLGAQITATPTVDSASNRLYIGVSNGNFIAVNKATGTSVWNFFTDSPIKNSAVVSCDRKLVCASAKGTIYGCNLILSEPLTPYWTLALSDSVLVSPAVDANGYFYFGSRGGKIYKVNLPTGSPTCSIVWQTSALGSPVTSSLTIDGRGNLYFGTADGKLYSVKLSNGAVTWNFPTGGSVRSTGAISPSGTVYFGNDAGEIYGLDSNKNVKFYYIDSSKISCPILYNKGSLYFGNEAGRFFAIYDTTGETLEKAGIFAGIYSPMWSTFQNNNRRTGNGYCYFLPPAPAAPLLVNPANLSVGLNLSLNLIWQRSLGALTYRVQLATDSLFTSPVVNDSTVIDSVKAVSGLIPLTYYWWRINAKGIGGTSEYSAVYKFRTLGYPNPVSLINPPNNAVNQPLSILFWWSRASEQTSPFENSDNSVMLTEKKMLLPVVYLESIDAVSNYWFDMVTDTVSLANLTRDTTLSDTTKSVSGLANLTNYYWRVRAKNQIGWGNYSVWFNFTTIPLGPAQVTLKIIPGGLYNPGTGQLNMKDTIKVLLVDSATCTRVDSSKVKVDSVTFTANVSFSNAATGTYYLYVFHRNHCVTAAKFKQGIVRGSTVAYDFTTDSSKAFGNNMIKVSTAPVLWGMIPGDANVDGYIDALDQLIWIYQNGLDGYLTADFNGDTYVDALDQFLWITWNGQSYWVPCELTFENVIEHKNKLKNVINNKEIRDIFVPKNKNR